MKKYRNFKCSRCLVVFEKRVEDDVKTLDCECGSEALRQLSAPKHFDNTTGRSPSAFKPR